MFYEVLFLMGLYMELKKIFILKNISIYLVQKEEFSVTWYMCDAYTWQRGSLFLRENPIFSSERILHKDYDRKGSFTKKKNIWSWGLKGLVPRRTDWRYTAIRKVTLDAVS
jgi:hypothetical protein